MSNDEQTLAQAREAARRATEAAERAARDAQRRADAERNNDQ